MHSRSSVKDLCVVQWKYELLLSLHNILIRKISPLPISFKSYIQKHAHYNSASVSKHHEFFIHTGKHDLTENNTEAFNPRISHQSCVTYSCSIDWIFSMSIHTKNSTDRARSQTTRKQCRHPWDERRLNVTWWISTSKGGTSLLWQCCEL